MNRIIVALLTLLAIAFSLRNSSLRTHLFGRPKGRTFAILTPTQQTINGRRVLSGEVEIAFEKAGKKNLQTGKILPCVLVLISAKAEMTKESRSYTNSDYVTEQICLPYPEGTDPTRSDSFSLNYPGGDFENSWQEKDDMEVSQWVAYQRIQKASLTLQRKEGGQYHLKYDYQGIKLEWSNTTFRVEAALDLRSGKPIQEVRSVDLMLAR